MAFKKLPWLNNDIGVAQCVWCHFVNRHLQWTSWELGPLGLSTRCIIITTQFSRSPHARYVCLPEEDEDLEWEWDDEVCNASNSCFSVNVKSCYIHNILTIIFIFILWRCKMDNLDYLSNFMILNLLDESRHKLAG